MSFHVEVAGGTSLKLPTAGRYCARDIVVTGTGYTQEDLTARYSAGLEAGTAACAARHFVFSFVGDGESEVSFHVPFEPDAIQIIGLDPTYNKTPYALGMFYCDTRAFGLAGGLAQHGSATGSSISSIYTTTSILSRYSRTEDGVITIGNFSSSSDVVFSPGYTYTVIAVKYTEQTDSERITAFVNRLSGIGTVTLNQAKVTAAFTDDEWAGLIAAKPDWTFTWI